ncbi:MAG: FHIPEP family type III secretion protein [Treponema sp.]|jgi:flagellar biosynthesis protein FlhA|nr:FHIPEP family type III secretion protein [Treponema sp.]
MGKSVPFAGSDNPDPGEEFNRFFPSRNQEIFEKTEYETEVLKLFRCLPLEYVSPEFLGSLLGPRFPLGDTLASLAAKGALVRNEQNGSFLLSRLSVLGDDCVPDVKDGAALMALISDNLRRARDRNDNSARLNWLDFGRSVLEKFKGRRDPELAEFRRILIKNYSDADRRGEAQELMEKIPRKKSRLPAREKREADAKYPSSETFRFLLPYISFCDVIVTNRGSVAAGLRFDEENMFAPMIMVLEEGFLAEAVIRAAENLEVPVAENAMLAGNLFAYGKLGETIPELCYRAVASVLSRLGTKRAARRQQVFRKNGRGLMVKIKRPFLVELGAAVRSFMYENPAQENLLFQPLGHIRRRLRRLLGFPLPPVKVIQNERLRPEEYRVLFKGIEAGRGRLDLAWYSGAESENPASAAGHVLNSPERIRAAAAAGAGIIVRHVEEIALRRTPDLLGRDEVQAILDAAEEKFPVVTGEVKNLLSLGSIREILQSLVSEQVSIRHIEVILETLADWGNFGPAPNEVIIEQIRQSLKRQICLEYADDGLTLRVLTLDSNLDQSFADRASVQDSKPVQNQGGFCEEFMDVFSPAIHGMEEQGLRPVILCSPMARSWIKEMTRRKFPDLAVLSYIEIPPDISVEPVGEIRLEGQGSGC